MIWRLLDCLIVTSRVEEPFYVRNTTLGTLNLKLEFITFGFSAPSFVLQYGRYTSKQ